MEASKGARKAPKRRKIRPRERPNALKTTENVPRTAEAIIIRKTLRIMKGFKRPYARSYLKYV